MKRFSFFSLLVTLVFMLADTTAAQAALQIGIGDQKASMFNDARYTNLQIRQVRFIMPYDEAAAGNFWRSDAWMNAAHAQGVNVLVAFNHSATHPKTLPSDATYRLAVSNFRARYPWVKEMSAWNEANHKSQPTQRKPKRAAQYYNIMRQECQGCKIVAADVLDQGGMPAWIKEFKRYAKSPKIWGLHNYTDSNRGTSSAKKSATYKFTKLVKGEIWLTETGGIVRFGSGYKGGKSGEEKAAKATKRAFSLARSSSRFTRIYLYHWSADPVFVTWDSGLVAADGRLRPAYWVLRDQISKQRKSEGLAVLAPVPTL
jgi:hypothetical protein